MPQRPELQDRFESLGEDDVICDNLMLDDECKNALIYKEDIDAEQLLQDCLFCGDVADTENIMFSRELLDAMQRGYTDYFQTEAL